MTDSNSELFPLENIPEELRDSVGFVIHYPKANHVFRDHYSELLIKDNLKSFLLDILEIMDADNEFTSFDKITEYLKSKNKPSGQTMVYDRIKNLKATGLFDERFYQRHKSARKAKILTLKPPMIDTASLNPELLNTPPVEKTSSNDAKKDAEERQRLIKAQFGDQMLDETSNRSYRDMMMSSILAKCIRLNDSDTRKKLVTNFHYKDAQIDVTTTTQTDGNIAVSKDIRYTMVITTFCLEILRRFLDKHQDPELKPPNEFVIDLSEVCTHIGNKRTTGNRLTAYKSTKRLYQTNFEIKTAQESEFAKRFLEGYNESNYRFLTDFKAIVHDIDDTDDLFSDEEEHLEEISNPRYVRISLWPSSFDNMWEQVVNSYFNSEKPEFINYYIQNPEVVKNQAPLAYHLFSHLSSWVGVKGYSKKECTTSDLYRFMLKTSKYQNYVRALIGLFKGLQPSDEEPITINTPKFKLNFYGYYIEGRALTVEEQRADLGRKGFHLKFYRDVKDKYIGDQSKHNKLIREQQAQDAKHIEDTLAKSVELTESDKARTQLHIISDELGKSPDSLDIPKAKVLSGKGDGNISFEDSVIFPELREEQ